MRLAYKVVVNEHKHNNSSVSNYNCVTTQSGLCYGQHLR